MRFNLYYIVFIWIIDVVYLYLIKFDGFFEYENTIPRSAVVVKFVCEQGVNKVICI